MWRLISATRFFIYFFSSMRMSTTKAPNMGTTFHHYSISNVIFNFIKILFSCHDFTNTVHAIHIICWKIKETSHARRFFPRITSHQSSIHKAHTPFLYPFFLGLVYLGNVGLFVFELSLLFFSLNPIGALEEEEGSQHLFNYTIFFRWAMEWNFQWLSHVASPSFLLNNCWTQLSGPHFSFLRVDFQIGPAAFSLMGQTLNVWIKSF